MLRRLGEIGLMLGGILVSIAAYADTGKAWVGAFILLTIIGIQEILHRQRKP